MIFCYCCGDKRDQALEAAKASALRWEAVAEEERQRAERAESLAARNWEALGAFRKWAASHSTKDDDKGQRDEMDTLIQDAKTARFEAHLKKTSAEVATWPEWKRNILK